MRHLPRIEDTRHLRYFSTLCLLLSLLLFGSPVATFATPGDDAQLRQKFLEAERMLISGHVKNFRKIESELKDYPLYPYLKLREMRASRSKFSDQQIAATLDSLPIPIASSFWSWWFNRLYKGRKWDLIANYFPNATTTPTQCRYVEALLALKRYEQAIPVIEKLWLVGKSQPSECDSMFQFALRNNFVTERLIWKRLLLTTRRNDRKMSAYLKSLLETSEAKYWATQLQRVQKRPVSTLRKNTKDWIKTAYGKELLEFGFNAIFRRDIDAAVELWVELKTKRNIAVEQLHSVNRQIGYRLGLKHHPDAYAWLSKIPETDHSITTRQWLIRSALLRENWPAVLQAISNLPPTEASNSVWKFWRARALHETGNQTAAKEIWTQLSADTTYYGLLAADYLNIEHKLVQVDLNLPDEVMVSVRQHPFVARVRELLHLGRPYSARRELLSYSEPQQKQFWLATAVMFERWGWHDGSTRVLAKALDDDEVDYHIQYPTPYIAFVNRESRRNSIPAHWIYGIIKQESNFVHDIRSSASAIGLMQLLPSTARHVAGRLKIKKPTRKALTDPALNIRLGSAYFDRLVDQWDGNLIFALASYNAGPNRVRRWRKSSHQTDPAIWVEAIPFKETAGYVRKVLKNFVVYEHTLELNYRQISDYLVLPKSNP